MDTRTLIAFGMLLAVLTVALLKGTLDGAAAKEVLQNIASGLIGGAVGFRVAQATARPSPPTGGTPPKGTPTLPVLLLLAGSALLLVSCATVEGEKRVPMGCVDPLSVECPDPSAFPPLAAMLPTKRTFGIPEPMQSEQQPYVAPPDTPASRLLKKLGK